MNITYHATLADFAEKASELSTAGYSLEPAIQTHGATHQPAIRAFNGAKIARIELNAMNDEAHCVKRTTAFDMACSVIDAMKGN